MRIYYFVPEDGDEAAHPNAFSIPDQAPTVAKIKESFPLRPNNGEYFLFRFKYKIKHAIKFVWLDVTADSAQAPRNSTSSIFMKVSRMTIEDSNQAIVNQEVTQATQKPRSKARSAPPKQTQKAPSNVDADIFKLKTTAEEGFICPQCKGVLNSMQDLHAHQKFCPGAPAERTRATSGNDQQRLLSFGVESPSSAPSPRLVSFSTPTGGDDGSAGMLNDLVFTSPAPAPAPAPASSPSKKGDGIFANLDFSM